MLPPDALVLPLSGPAPRGYTPMGDETVDPEHQSEGDNKEGLYFGRDLLADCEEAKKPMHGPNQWPDAIVMPDFKPVMTAYFDAVCVCSGQQPLQAALARTAHGRGLGVTPPTCDWYTLRLQACNCARGASELSVMLCG